MKSENEGSPKRSRQEFHVLNLVVDVGLSSSATKIREASQRDVSEITHRRLLAGEVLHIRTRFSL